MMRIRARHYRTSQWIELVCKDGLLQSITPTTDSSPADLIADWVAPALFDLQINGCHGHAFVSPSLTVDAVGEVVRHCRNHGIAGLCPTLITGSYEALSHGFTTLRQACEQNRQLDRAMPCFHLEGPYISPEDGPRGAHRREHVRPPDLDEFRRWQEAAGGRIRLVTLSPEYDQSLNFIEKLVAQGVVTAIGHTAATPQRIREAIRAGASLSTHLGNGSHAMLPRHENYLWEQLAADTLWASFIPDGHHLPQALLRCLIRSKTPARLIVTCDASSLAGLPEGRYTMWEQELEILPGGKIVVPGTTFLAGSGLFTDNCLSVLIKLGECRLDEVLDMAGAHPRKLLGLPRIDLEPGAPADLVLFEQNPQTGFRLCATLVAGECANAT